MVEEGANSNGNGGQNSANPEQMQLGQPILPAHQRTAWYWKILTKRKDGESEPQYVVRLKRLLGLHAFILLLYFVLECSQVALLWVNMLRELGPFQYTNASPFLILSHGLKDQMDKLALFLVLGYGKAVVFKATAGIFLASGVCCLKPLPLLLAAALITIELCHDAFALLFWTLYVIPFRSVAKDWEHAVRAITALLLFLYLLGKFVTVCLTLAFRELLVMGQVEMAERFTEMVSVDGNQVAPALCCFTVEDENEEAPAVVEPVETKPVVLKVRKAKSMSRASKRVRKSTIKIV